MNLGGVIKYRFGSEGSGYPYWDMGQHVDRRFTGFIFTANTWYFVVFTGKKDGTNIHTRFYINGELKTSLDEGITSLTNADDLLIGTGEGPSVHPFNGIIDEVRIHNRALSAEEIVLLYLTTA